jgi:CHAT domain-containing protein
MRFFSIEKALFFVILTMKNSILVAKVTYLLFLLTFLITPVFSQKFDKYVVKVDVAYETGDYIKARKNNIKFRKKVNKKLGSQNNYVVEYYLMAARNELAMGELVDFNLNYAEAISLSEKVNTDNPKAHTLLLNRISNLLLQNSNPQQAAVYIKLAQEYVDKIEDNEDLKAFTDLNSAAVFSSQGYYAMAIQFILENEKHFSSRALGKETTIDAKTGKLKSVKLDSKEISKRRDEYARLLNLKANSYRLMGDFVKADETFLKAADWIGNNLGKANIRYVENKLWQGNMLAENGLDPKVSRKIYEDALRNLKKQHNESHYLALEIYESLLDSYLVNNELARFKNLNSEYERVLKKYFHKKSINYVKLDAMNFRASLDVDRTKNIEAKVKEILALDVIPEYHITRIKLLDFAYQAALINKTYASADKYLGEILVQKEALFGKKSPEYHLTLTEIANFYIDFTDKVAEAGRIYRESFEKEVVPQVTPGHINYVRTLNHQAKYFESTDKLKKASAKLDEALVATRAKYDNLDIKYGIELTKIADLQIKIGDYADATVNVKEAITILENERRDKINVVYYVTALETHAKLLSLRGEFEESKDLIKYAQKLLFRAEDLTQYDELASIIDLAEVFVKFGQVSETEDLLDKALTAYENLYGNSSRNLVLPLLSYGNLKLFTGEYTEAERFARRALNIAQLQYGKNSSKTAHCNILLARIYTAIGDYEKAQINIERALSIQEEVFGREHIDFAKSLSQKGIVMFYNQEDPEEIELVFEEAKTTIAEKLGSRTPMYADVLKNISLVYIQEHRFDDAFNSLSLAEVIWETRLKAKKNINIASIYTLTGDVYYQQKNYEYAENKYKQAKKLYESFFNPNHPEYVRVISKLAKVYYMQGDKRKAKNSLQEVIDKYDSFIKIYFPALSEREKAKFWNTIKTDYEFYVSLAMTFKDDDPKMIEKVYNNALTTKAILLSSSIKIRKRILNGNDEELKSLYNEWLSKKEFLTTALSMSFEQLAANEINPVQLQDDVEQLEKELSERSELIKESNEQSTITWQDVQGVLKKNEVAIEMVRYRYFDHVFTDSVIYAGLYIKNVKEQRKPSVFTLNNGKDLETKYFNAYRNSIILRRRDHFSNAQYWLPISEVVGPTATIYLSADGVYNQINLEAIPVSDTEYVLDNSNIILVSNTKDIYLNTLKAKPENSIHASMFGNPSYYLEASANIKRSIGQLKGTEAEINGLNKLLEGRGWKIDTKLEKEATEASIKMVDSPEIIHIATHGFFKPASKVQQNALAGQNEAKLAENPLLRTGLLMAGAGDLLNKTKFNYNIEDGILTAYEAMSMNLDKTALVVLSACETGLGDLTVGEGVYGLQRAFMVAGAQTLIMSMFKVSDEATQKLMVNFYQKWLSTGKKRESFVQAKKELRNEFKDPKDWGAFIMIGLE